MRVLPEVPVTCHVCDSTFSLHHRGMRERDVVTEPSRCPHCDAPIRFAPAVDIGVAKTIMLAEDSDAAREQTLSRFCRTEDDVQTVLALVGRVDLEAWHDELTRAPTSTEVRIELRRVRELRDATTRGRLQSVLEAAASRVSAQRRREREQHLAVFETRRRRKS